MSKDQDVMGELFSKFINHPGLSGKKKSFKERIQTQKKKRLGTPGVKGTHFGEREHNVHSAASQASKVAKKATQEAAEKKRAREAKAQENYRRAMNREDLK